MITVKYDVMFLGPATRDINIDYTRDESRKIGGAVYFCTWVAKSTGAKICAAVKINEQDTDIKECLKNFAFLKTDAKKEETLTKQTDLREVAKKYY